LEVVAGRAFLVNAETKIIALSTSYAVSEIRISKHNTGCVPNEFIKPN
jgi:hypothetical protein